jgi:hypothetical protein
LGARTGDDKRRSRNAPSLCDHESAAQGYDRSNPLRVETADEARHIDERIARAWSGHPRRYVIESGANFLDEMLRALEAIRLEVPDAADPTAFIPNSP